MSNAAESADRIETVTVEEAMQAMERAVEMAIDALYQAFDRIARESEDEDYEGEYKEPNDIFREAWLEVSSDLLDPRGGEWRRRTLQEAVERSRLARP